MTIDCQADRAETGRALGHDLYRYGRWLPVADDRTDAASLAEGHAQARARAVGRLHPDRHERKWLQLRLNAWRRGRAIAADVTPALLREIDVPRCPVTRCLLTHGERADTDWSVDRLDNDGAYAANNLAIVSVAANRAKGSRSFEAVHALAQREEPAEGLTPAAWLRLAALMLGPCFATRPQAAPALPLTVPLPPRAAHLALQQVQHVLATRASPQSGKNALIKHFKAASRGEQAQAALRTLAEAVHQGLKTTDREYPCDIWLQPSAMSALIAWRAALEGAGWGLADEISRALAGSRCVPASRLLSWRLDTRGYDIPMHPPRAANPWPARVAPTPLSLSPFPASTFQRATA